MQGKVASSVEMIPAAFFLAMGSHGFGTTSRNQPSIRFAPPCRHYGPSHVVLRTFDKLFSIVYYDMMYLQQTA